MPFLFPSAQITRDGGMGGGGEIKFPYHGI